MKIDAPHAPSQQIVNSPLPGDDVISRYAHLEGAELLDAMIHEAFPGRIAVSSSFGTESAVLLHLVSQIAPDTPILFLNTGLLFAQTEQYQRTLQKHLGLSDVRIIQPNPDHLELYDPDNTLNERDTDTCCHLRKVLPMQQALGSFDAWITGRKRFQGSSRNALAMIEHDGSHYKINPIANWSPEKIKSEFEKYKLPRHLLESVGYTSIGCFPCTRLPLSGQDSRSGRWADQEKTECGIHAPWAGDSI
jgi:phosphoadenosine phosphosulfate reductase